MTRQHVWDDLPEESKYVVYQDNQVTVKFIDNDFTVGTSNYEGIIRPQYNFEVLDMTDNSIKTFSVTSIRLMRLLKELSPLEGLTCLIKRVGAGKDMTYTVEKK